MMPMMTNFEHPYENPTNPELRRMAMLSRARREEMDAMIFGMNPRHTVVRTGNTVRKHEGMLSRTINRMREGIGGTLISAGNRIQSGA